jgi:hypothetical protein
VLCEQVVIEESIIESLVVDEPVIENSMVEPPIVSINKPAEITFTQSDSLSIDDDTTKKCRKS